MGRGNAIRQPAIRISPSEFLGTAERLALSDRLRAWLAAHIAGQLRPLARLEAAQPAGASRGLVYELCEGLGAVPRPRLAAQLAALDPAARAKLRRQGVRFGRQTIYLAGLLPPRAAELRCALWATHNAIPVPEVPRGNGVSFRPSPGMPAAFYLSLGYVLAGPLAVRVDKLEALLRRLARFARQGPYLASDADMAGIAADPPAFAAVVEASGFVTEHNGGTVTVRLRGRGKRNGRKRIPRPRRDPDSPFARLRDLQLAR